MYGAPAYLTMTGLKRLKLRYGVPWASWTCPKSFSLLAYCWDVAFVQLGYFGPIQSIASGQCLYSTDTLVWGKEYTKWTGTKTQQCFKVRGWNWQGRFREAQAPTYVRPRPHSFTICSHCYIKHSTCDNKERHISISDAKPSWKHMDMAHDHSGYMGTNTKVFEVGRIC